MNSLDHGICHFFASTWHYSKVKLLRILIVGETYQPDVNGAAVFTKHLAEGLTVRGHDVYLVCPSPVGPSYQETVGGVHVHRVPSYSYPWHSTFHIVDPRRVSRSIENILEDVAPDVVHIQAHFIAGRSAANLASKKKIPLVATNHFMPENLASQAPVKIPPIIFRVASWFAWKDVARVFKHAQIVTAPTPYAVDLLARRTGIDEGVPISCGVDLSAYRSLSERKSTGPTRTILFVGRLELEKNLEELISAMQFLGDETRLRIVGEGSQMKRLLRCARRMGVDSRVQFLGFLTDPELRDEYRNADIFCMPSTAELQSIATLEAMASGLPIVVARAGALPHLFSPHENGTAYDPGNIRELARAITSILEDKQRMGAYSQASTANAQNHDLDKTVLAYEALYYQAIE